MNMNLIIKRLVLLFFVVFVSFMCSVALAEEGRSAVFTSQIGDEKLTCGVIEAGDPGAEPEIDGAPSSYAIAPDGDVYIVDTYGKHSPIKVFSKEGIFLKKIGSDRFHTSGISSIVIQNNWLFALTYDSTLCKYDLDRDVLQKVERLPRGVISHSYRGMVSVGSYIAFTSYDAEQSVWLYNGESGEFLQSKELYSVNYDQGEKKQIIYFDKIEYSIPVENSETPIYPMGQDADKNLLVEYNNTTYRSYSVSGELQGIAQRHYDMNSLYLGNPARVGDGKLYFALCLGEKYEISEIELGQIAITLEDVENIARKDDYRVAPQAQAEPKEVSEDPYCDRATAIEEARKMLQLKWKVASKSNITNSSNGQITVPSIFRGEQLRGVSVGVEFVGIPYCWGGMNGLERCGSAERKQPFLEMIKNKKRAGNVLCEGKYKSGSAGVDCSGYVSICYGMTKKRSSKWFTNSYGHELDSFMSLQSGDYIAKQGHVMLVVEPPQTENGTMRVIQATKNKMEGIRSNGTVEGVLDYDYYKSFIPITPWHVWTPFADSYTCTLCGEMLGQHGDASCDGVVNTADATLVMRHCIGASNLTMSAQLIADINRDGRVNTADAVDILRYASR